MFIPGKSAQKDKLSLIFFNNNNFKLLQEMLYPISFSKVEEKFPNLASLSKMYIDFWAWGRLSQLQPVKTPKTNTFPTEYIKFYLEILACVSIDTFYKN